MSKFPKTKTHKWRTRSKITRVGRKIETDRTKIIEEFKNGDLDSFFKEGFKLTLVFNLSKLYSCCLWVWSNASFLTKHDISHSEHTITMTNTWNCLLNEVIVSNVCKLDRLTCGLKIDNKLLCLCLGKSC